MEALTKKDAFGKQHRCYQIGNFENTCRELYLSENFRRYVYVDENFEYFIVEKYRTENNNTSIYRTIVVPNIVGRVIHGVYSEYMFYNRDLLRKLQDEYVGTRLEFPLSGLAMFGLPVDKALEVVNAFPNASSKELLTVLNQM
jgi:hypothetical protein